MLFDSYELYLRRLPPSATLDTIDCLGGVAQWLSRGLIKPAGLSAVSSPNTSQPSRTTNEGSEASARAWLEVAWVGYLAMRAVA